ncbi:MAG: AMP-dependent synthetase/ligase [Acidobacteriota bacterium]
MKFSNIYQFINSQVEKYGNQAVFYERRQNTWQPITWNEFFTHAVDFACGLKALGFTENNSVGVFMSNRPQWAYADVGTIIAGGISVGLYPTSSAEQCEFIINHADAEFVVVDSKDRLEKILSIRGLLPNLKKIIWVTDEITDDSQGITSFDKLLAIGRNQSAECKNRVIESATQTSAEAIAIMVYTSGTTGQPKGACLSHRYVINSAQSVVESLNLQSSDTGFSYLPFCHVAERIAGFYTRLYAGTIAYFVDDVANLYSYMLEIKPTIFASLPRFFEKIHARIMADVEQFPEGEQQQFIHALQVGKILSRLQQNGEPVPQDLFNQHQRTSQLLSEKVKQYTGGNIRMMTSGGAPLPVEIGEFFDAAGVPILEAYGLTENVCVAFNRPAHHRFGTVGPAMVGCEIHLADDGEILVRSDMMFSGYYKEPEKTAEMFKNGWLVTGDLGELDDRGFLKITGRKKELIITSTGKNIAPLVLENRLKEHPLISHAMIHGDGKSYLVALITLNQIELEEYAKIKGIDFQTYSELTENPEVRLLIQQQVDAINLRVSSTEAIKKFVILSHDLSLEADEITPTLKVKRNIVTMRYKELLVSLYQ